MPSKLRLIFVNSFLLLTSGCVGVIGEEETTCPNSHAGVICASSREIYNLTNNYDSAEEYAAATGDPRVISTDEEGNIIEKKELSTSNQGASNINVNPPQQNNGTFSAADNAYQAQLLPAPEPLAMRKPASIVRVLTRPYATSEDTLKVPGYAYVEAESRTWVIDRNAQIDNAQFTSVAMRRDSIKQDYTPKDPNQIGVDNRTGEDATLTNMQVQENARLEAAKLIQSAQNLEGFK